MLACIHGGLVIQVVLYNGCKMVVVLKLGDDVIVSSEFDTVSRVGTVEFWGKSPCYWKQLVWVRQWYGLRSHVHIWFWDFYRPPCFIVIFWIMLSQRFYLSYCLLHTHTHPFNGPFSGTTRVSRYQKGKTGFYWSKRQWVAVASAGPYASLHLAPDR